MERYPPFIQQGNPTNSFLCLVPRVTKEGRAPRFAGMEARAVGRNSRVHLSGQEGL